MAEETEDEALTYERARDALVDVVRRLEAGGLTLEESLELWERGERFATTCDEWLEGARARLAAAIGEHTEDRTESGAAGDPSSEPPTDTPF